MRLQLQIYNIFNMAQFTRMITNLQFQDDPTVPGADSLRLNSTDTARYDQATPPRYIGLTLRLDFYSW